MRKNSIEKTIITGVLIDGFQPLLVENADAFANTDIVASVVSRYEPRSGHSNPWWGWTYEGWSVVSVGFWSKFNLRCVLSKEGQVRLYGPGGKPDRTYQIPEAGVFGDAAAGFGYVNRIRAIGDHLYVCGMGRQVYRFTFDGKNLSTGQWQDFAGGMRQPPISNPPEDDTDAEAFDRWMEENDAIDLVDIDGTRSNDIYAVGEEAWHWNGTAWRQLTLPTDEPLQAIEIATGSEVYLVGHNGTLLKGSAQTGFVDLSGVEDNQTFTGVETFQGRLYLASNVGLFLYDDVKKKILPCKTGLVPELQDTHVLEAKDGILWSIGYKDLAWFDGKTWTRVDHPDNPPIR